jgi:RPA family protein
MAKRRQPAKRLFIQEIKNAHEQVEKDGTKFAVTPLGDEVNRVFLVATIIDYEENEGTLRLRLADPSGGMSVWISDRTLELQQKAKKLAQDMALVAISGKIRVVNENFTTLRVEKICKADENTRNIWLKEALERAKALVERSDTEFAERFRETIALIEEP